jgi:ubiquinone/menaquinone biosynthesis C-methylase UbiE
MHDRGVDEPSADLKGGPTQLAEAYDRWHQNIFRSGEGPDQDSPWYRLVLEYLVPVQGKRILEVACGRGGFGTVLESLGATVCGVDFSIAALRVASQKANRDNITRPHVGLSQADAHHLPFASGVFDCLISCETIEHLAEPLNAVKEMARVCRSGGLLYLTTPNYLNLMGLYLVYDAIFKKNRHSLATQPLDRHWLFPRVRQIIERSGWKILKSDGTVHQVPVPGRSPFQVDFLERSRLLRHLLSPVALHYFVVAEKRGA